MNWYELDKCIYNDNVSCLNVTCDKECDHYPTKQSSQLDFKKIDGKQISIEDING